RGCANVTARNKLPAQKECRQIDDGGKTRFNWNDSGSNRDWSTRSSGMDLRRGQFESGIRSAPMPIFVKRFSGARGSALVERAAETGNESRHLQIPRVLKRSAHWYGRSNAARGI